MMKTNRKAVFVAMILATLALSLVTVEDAAALPAPQEGVTIEATSSGDFFDKIVEAFERVINAFVDMILAPIRALNTIWENWAETLGDWYAPILVAFIVIIILVMYRLYGQLDDFLDGWT
jgi:hypothetical protein